MGQFSISLQFLLATFCDSFDLLIFESFSLYVNKHYIESRSAFIKIELGVKRLILLLTFILYSSEL